jgi:putative oxidoreductase
MNGNSIDLMLLVLRVVLGVTMAAHGYQKFFLGGRIPGTAGWFESLGMRQGTGRQHALMAASTEIGSGALMALGLFTPLAAAAFVGLMFVAGYTHRDHGFYVFKEGFEYNLVLAVVAVTIATISPGRWSLDNAFGIIDWNWYGWRGLLISAGLGLVASIVLLAVYYRTPQKSPT